MFYDLHLNGYNVIPQTVGGDNERAKPLIPKFRGMTFTPDEAADWDDKFHDANIALVTGTNAVAVIDVDCTDLKITSRLRNIILKEFPGIPLRLCNEPKFAVLFRMGDSLLNVKNGHSDVYRGNGGTQQIEYLGYNSLLTLYGTHRKPPYNTYRWGRRGANPLNIQAHELPVLEKAHIEWLFKIFNANAAKKVEWEYKSSENFTHHGVGGVTGMTASDDPMESAKLAPIYADHEIDKWLKQYDGSNYEQWNTAGRALHTHYKSSHKGLNKWDNWSKNFEGYEDGACSDAWAHFTEGAGTTIATIEREVRKEVKREENDVLQDMLDRYVLIEDGQLVGDTARTSAESLTKLPDFKTYMANRKIPVIKADGSVSNQKAVTVWLEHAARLSARGTCFMPVRDRVIQNIGNGQPGKYWNMYVSPDHRELEHEDPKQVNLFINHMNYIFDGKGDAEWMMDWMAHMIQKPLDRPTVTPLHINPNQRTGRGWVTKFVSQLVGRQNVGETKLEKMADSSAKDNYLDNTMVVFIHEIAPMDRAKMWKLYDALKTKLTEDYQQLDIKYGDNTMRKVYARFFLMSNNLTCLPIQEDDQRLYVMESNAQPQSPEYYQKLYEALDSREFMDNVYTFLKNRKIKRNRMTVCVHTKARQRIIERTRSGTAAAFHEAKERLGSLPFTKDMINGFITTHMNLRGMGAMELNDMELKHLYTEHCDNGVILEQSCGTMTAVHTFNDSNVTPTSETITTKLAEAEKELQWK